MFTKPKAVSLPKLHSIHTTPSGKEFVGTIESSQISKSGQSQKQVFQFRYTPVSAAIDDWRLVLTGKVTITPPVGSPRTISGVRAKLLATQGATTLAPTVPAGIDPKLVAPAQVSSNGLPLTEYTGNDGSIGVMFLKLSPLNSTQAGLPFDLRDVQLNARLWMNSNLERELLWLYSALLMATQGPRADDRWATGCLAELNKRLVSA
jgi:hypothetical protein